VTAFALFANLRNEYYMTVEDSSLSGEVNINFSLMKIYFDVKKTFSMVFEFDVIDIASTKFEFYEKFIICQLSHLVNNEKCDMDEKNHMQFP
jgi:hypothetical protein